MSWGHMLSRCYNPLNAATKYPGVWSAWRHSYVDRWRYSFENFYADMGERPPGKSLDRYPVLDGNYGPTNCRWATAREQTC